MALAWVVSGRIARAWNQERIVIKTKAENHRSIRTTSEVLKLFSPQRQMPFEVPVDRADGGGDQLVRQVVLPRIAPRLFHGARGL